MQREPSVGSLGSTSRAEHKTDRGPQPAAELPIAEASAEPAAAVTPFSPTVRDPTGDDDVIVARPEAAPPHPGEGPTTPTLALRDVQGISAPAEPGDGEPMDVPPVLAAVNVVTANVKAGPALGTLRDGGKDEAVQLPSAIAELRAGKEQPHHPGELKDLDALEEKQASIQGPLGDAEACRSDDEVVVHGFQASAGGEAAEERPLLARLSRNVEEGGTEQDENLATRGGATNAALRGTVDPTMMLEDFDDDDLVLEAASEHASTPGRESDHGIWSGESGRGSPVERLEPGGGTLSYWEAKGDMW